MRDWGGGRNRDAIFKDLTPHFRRYLDSLSTEQQRSHGIQRLGILAPHGQAYLHSLTEQERSVELQRLMELFVSQIYIPPGYGVYEVPIAPSRVNREYKLSILEGFRCLVRGAAREDVELAVSDLKRDVREKQKEEQSDRDIRRYIRFKTLDTIGPIACAAVARWIARILTYVLIRKFRGD